MPLVDELEQKRQIDAESEGQEEEGMGLTGLTILNSRQGTFPEILSSTKRAVPSCNHWPAERSRICVLCFYQWEGDSGLYLQ